MEDPNNPNILLPYRTAYPDHHLDREGTYDFLEYGTMEAMPKEHSQDIRRRIIEILKLRRQYELYSQNPNLIPFNPARRRDTLRYIRTQIFNLQLGRYELVRTKSHRYLLPLAVQLNLQSNRPLQLLSKLELENLIIAYIHGLAI